MGRKRKPVITTKRIRIRAPGRPYRWTAWVDGRSVLGLYLTKAEAEGAAETLTQTLDVPRLCTLKDIDEARRERAREYA